MDQGTAERSSSNRHIIGRPRLIQLLDATESPLILLVAPAGYGKTTLARQWVGSNGRTAIWHDVTTASTDVAVLAASIAEALSQLFPDAASSLGSFRTAAASASVIASEFAPNSRAWP